MLTASKYQEIEPQFTNENVEDALLNLFTDEDEEDNPTFGADRGRTVDKQAASIAALPRPAISAVT